MPVPRQPSARYQLSSTGIASWSQLLRYCAVCKYWHESDFPTWDHLQVSLSSWKWHDHKFQHPICFLPMHQSTVALLFCSAVIIFINYAQYKSWDRNLTAKHKRESNYRKVNGVWERKNVRVTFASSSNKIYIRVRVVRKEQELSFYF